MPTRSHILVVDGEDPARHQLVGHFSDQGYRVSEAPTGSALRDLIGRQVFDLVSLNIGLPDEDGIALLRDLRAASPVPVMVVTERHAEEDRLTALEVGADDYLVKPVCEREVVLRARNILRRVSAARPHQETVFRVAGWVLDPMTRRVRLPDGRKVGLTRGEFELLGALVVRAEQVVPRRDLLADLTHRGDVPTERTVDVLIGRLRRKIEPDPPRPRYIKTKHGRGYLFRAIAEA